MPLPLLIPLAVAAASYSTGTLVAAVASVGTVTGLTGGFLGWYFSSMKDKSDDQIDDMAKERIEKAKQYVTRVTSKSKNLKKLIIQLEEQKQKLLVEIQEFKTSINENKDTLEQHKNALSQVHAELSAQMIKLDECLKEISSLNAKLEESKKILGEKDSDILKVQNELVRLGGLITSQTETIESLTNQVLVLNRENEAVRKERDKYKRVIDDELTPKIGVLLQKIGVFQKKNGASHSGTDHHLRTENVLSMSLTSQ